MFRFAQIVMPFRRRRLLQGLLKFRWALSFLRPIITLQVERLRMIHKPLFDGRFSCSLLFWRLYSERLHFFHRFDLDLTVDPLSDSWCMHWFDIETTRWLRSVYYTGMLSQHIRLCWDLWHSASGARSIQWDLSLDRFYIGRYSHWHCDDISVIGSYPWRRFQRKFTILRKRLDCDVLKVVILLRHPGEWRLDWFEDGLQAVSV